MFKDVLNKLRYWDNKSAQWILRHFYILFFEVVLIVIFIFFFINAMSVVESGFDLDKTNQIEKLLHSQSVNTTLLLLLILFNSFWMLFIFRAIMSIRSSARSIEYNITKIRHNKNKKSDNL